ncbi:MAG: YihY/virulence factor BrkB family protein [Aquabacterium sp.]|nr:MAG: YihY/virulence factor BrkB family protein [Aquabacterium sp.]
MGPSIKTRWSPQPMDAAQWSRGLWRRVPSPIRWPLELFVRAVERWIDTGGSQLGAAIAFYTMFAVAPLLVVAIAIAGAVFGPDAARGQIVAQIQGLVGQAAAHDIETMIQSAWRHPGSLLASALGIATLLIGASGVFAMLRFALNAIYAVHRPPSAIGAFVRARLIGFALVLGFGFLAITSLLLSASLSAMRAYLSFVSLGVGELLSVLDFALSTAVLSVAFAALLRWLPDVPPSRRAVWVGAVVAAVLFAIGKHLIGLYLAHASVASAYGAAGSFVVIMLWVYYSAQILLFGGALGAELDEAAAPQIAGAGDRGTPIAQPAA